MGSIHRYPRGNRGRCEVVDVKAEMAEWKQEIIGHSFYEPGTSFSRYEPSLLFAYDSYLQHHKIPLDQLLQMLERKYTERFGRFERLNWHRMEALLREVWLRMGGSLGESDGNTHPRRKPEGHRPQA